LRSAGKPNVLFFSKSRTPLWSLAITLHRKDTYKITQHIAASASPNRDLYNVDNSSAKRARTKAIS
jgi:hypothetical protein